MPEVDLRAHHLFSLYTQLHSPKITKLLKGVKLAILGYKDPNFPNHLMRVIDNIIGGTTQKIRIVDGHDAVCEKCPQKREGYCETAYGNHSANFLSLVDQTIAANAGLEIGASYDATEILDRMKTIRGGLLRTATQMPSLIALARLMDKADK
ncbi:MAG: DUF1284 domain-containing protein [Candidatus Gracilibacteria bacterium]|jgi:hypothetical protein